MNENPGPDTPPTIGQIAAGLTPAFDIGFQSDTANQIENALGYAAINTEELYGSLGDALDRHLNQAYTNTALAQTSLQESLGNLMNQAKANTQTVQNSLESSLAGQMGMPLEATQQLAPNNAFVQQTMPVQPVNTAPAIGPHLGLNPPGLIPAPEPGLPAPPIWTSDLNCQDFAAKIIAQAEYYVAHFMALGPNPPTAQSNADAVDAAYKLLMENVNAANNSNYPLVGNNGPCPKGMTGFYFSSQGGWRSTYTFCLPCATPGTAPPPPAPVPPPYNPPTVPPTCCPPIKFPDCIKICDVTPKKCEEPVYQVFCNRETHLLTVVLRSDTSSSTSGTLIAEGKASEIDWLKICGQCPIDQNQPPEEPIIGNPPQFARGAGCDGIVQFPLWVNPGDTSTFYDAAVASVDKMNGQMAPDQPILASAINSGIELLLPHLGSLADTLLGVITNLLGGTGCDNAASIQTFGTRALYGLASKFVGSAVEPLDRIAEYGQNAICPYLLPSADQAVRQFLTDSIGIDRLKCLVETNGFRWDTFQPLVDSSRTRWNAAETVMLWRRQKLNLQECDNSLRQLGYIGAAERQGLRDLTEQVPAVSDLMSMMIRDVADEINVDWTESDKIFAQKWDGQLKKWGDFQGVPEKMAQYIWRAHWTLPSPTQLYEFWHRLRNNPAFGGPQKFFQRIKNTLIQQDILPDWIDAFIAVSFKPLTRVDAKRAFALGVLKEDALRTAFLDQGYSDDNATTMTEYTKAQLRATVANSPLIKKYASGEINSAELGQTLELQGLPDTYVQGALQIAKNYLSRTTRKACVASYRKQYLLGEIKYSELNASLSGTGLDAEQVDALAKAFSCQRAARGKTVPAATLCGWYERGAINETDLYSRLLNLGYTQDDAAGLTRDCMTRVGLKLDKQKAAELKRAALQEQQEQRLAAQQAKALNAAIAAKEKQITKAQSVQQQRQKQVIEIGRLWSDKVGLPLGDAVLLIKTLVNQQAATGLAPINTIIMAAKAAVQDGMIMTRDDLVRQMAITIADVTS